MKNNKAKHIGIIIVVALLLGGAVLVAKNIFPTVNATLEITNALKPFLDATNKSMHLLIDAEVEETVTQLDMDIYAIKEELDFFVIKQENSFFYIVDDLLILENGKAFLLADENQNTQGYTVNYMDMMPLLATAFDEFEISRTEEDKKIAYKIDVTGEQMQKLLDVALPSQGSLASFVEKLQVQLTTQNGVLDEIQMKGIGASKEAQVLLSMHASNFMILEDGAYKIPLVVKDSAKNADKEELFCLTEDLYRLIKAMEPLSDMSKLQGNMNWQISCGPIQINTSLDLEKLNAMKPDESNKGDTSEGNNTETAAELIGLMGSMIMEGDIRCTEQDEIYGYELVLNEAAMKQLVETIAPEIVQYAIDFEQGSMKIEVKGEQLSTITIGIEGSFKALISKVPVSVRVEFEFK